MSGRYGIEFRLRQCPTAVGNSFLAAREQETVWVAVSADEGEEVARLAAAHGHEFVFAAGAVAAGSFHDEVISLEDMLDRQISNPQRKKRALFDFVAEHAIHEPVARCEEIAAMDAIGRDEDHSLLGGQLS